MANSKKPRCDMLRLCGHIGRLNWITRSTRGSSLFFPLRSSSRDNLGLVWIERPNMQHRRRKLDQALHDPCFVVVEHRHNPQAGHRKLQGPTPALSAPGRLLRQHQRKLQGILSYLQVVGVVGDRTSTKTSPVCVWDGCKELCRV